ncbi:MAG: sugar phosphate isomerase/epimerase [Armatimonadetes bacterium]|nr:sugar phosphate isomerase/epimerase [Armatimonadota bacterium]
MPDNHFHHQLVGSPCCLPKWSYEELLPAYRNLGFTKFEAFSEWAQARLNWCADPAIAVQKATDAGIAITSFHLPVIGADDIEAGLDNAVAAARYAQGVGAKTMLFKAASSEVFGKMGIGFLDALDREQITVTPVVQNHRGTAISTLEDYQEVFDRLDNDPRLKAVLEVGHFHRVGVSWQTGWDFLSDRIALIHVNDIRDGNSVHYGTGEVDFAGLLQKIKATNYQGEIVVELELENRDTNPQETLQGLQSATALLTRLHSAA